MASNAAVEILKSQFIELNPVRSVSFQPFTYDDTIAILEQICPRVLGADGIGLCFFQEFSLIYRLTTMERQSPREVQEA